jgi:serine/threonine protein kinase
MTLQVLKNRYHPIEPVGSGGFGKTYLAKDLNLNDRLCAIKQFAPQTDDEWSTAKARELFEREALSLKRLGVHAQIPSLFDYFAVEDNLYLIQEYIEGQTLKDELKTEGVFDEFKIRQVLEDLLNIVIFVHQQGAIHRDIKPQNIMRRSSDRQLILIDFGIVKNVTFTVLGQPATRIGSSGYVPREQLEIGDVSSNCDLYGIGATCFHLLTGVHPRQLVDREGYYWVQNWRKHLQQPISKELGTIFDRLLQVESRRRYQLAEQVLSDLNQINAGNSPKKALLKGFKRQNNAKSSSKSNLSPNFAPTIIDRDGGSLPEAPRQQQQNWLSRPRLKLFGGGALLILALSATQIYNYFRYNLFPSNPLYTLVAPSSDIFLQRTLRSDRGWINALHFSNDGKSLFSATEAGSIERWDMQTDRPIKILQDGGDRFVALAANESESILVSGEERGKVRVWNENSGIEKTSFKIDNGELVALVLTEDSRRAVIAIEGRNKAKGKYRIETWDLTEGKLASKLEGDGGGILSLALSGDDRYLVAGTIDRSLKIWNFQTGKLEKNLSLHTDYIESLAITPDNKLLISGSADRTIKIWDLSKGQLRQTLTGHDDVIKALAISPDGEILVSAGVDRQIRFWQPRTGRLIATYLGRGNSITSLAISPDGKTLVSGDVDGSIELWQMP